MMKYNCSYVCMITQEDFILLHNTIGINVHFFNEINNTLRTDTWNIISEEDALLSDRFFAIEIENKNMNSTKMYFLTVSWYFRKISMYEKISMYKTSRITDFIQYLIWNLFLNLRESLKIVKNYSFNVTI